VKQVAIAIAEHIDKIVEMGSIFTQLINADILEVVFHVW